jgi:hypothetical protein
MWQTLFGTSVFAFWQAGLIWTGANEDVALAAVTFAAIGLLTAAAAGHLRQ